MHLSLASEGAGPGRVQEFLLRQFGVVRARVWSAKGRLIAAVTVSDDNNLSEADLRWACEKGLGADATPTLWILDRSVRLAA